ncbi:hypothetical protein L1887_51097 [Cichorium endivia]|nr:hypothetical protein L1887_51097 [Cichorium endivia]
MAARTTHPSHGLGQRHVPLGAEAPTAGRQTGGGHTHVPPQPNSPPDNVFRPDRPAEAGLGSKKRGIAPPLPIHGIIGFPLSVTSSELAVRRTGKGPRRSRSQSVPRPARGDPLSPRKQLEQSADKPTGSGLGPPCPALRANPFPEVTDPFLPTSPCLHCSIDQRLFTLET